MIILSSQFSLLGELSGQRLLLGGGGGAVVDVAAKVEQRMMATLELEVHNMSI